MTAIDWWALGHTALWIAGLAVILAALSMASYRSHADRVRVRRILGERGFQIWLNGGLGLFCLGLLLGSGTWWERVLWAGLAMAFAVQSVRAWRRRSAGHSPDRGVRIPERGQKASPHWQSVAHSLAQAEIWVVGLLVAASVVSARVLPWTVGVAAAFWIVRWLAYGRPSVRTPADWGILVLLAMVPVTLWATAWMDVTRFQVYRLLCGVALYYALANWTLTRPRVRLLVLGFVLASLFLAFYAPVGVWWSFGRLSFVPDALYQAFPMFTSDTVNPNVMAGTLAILVPFAFAVVLFGWGRSHWAYWALAGFAVVAITGILIFARARGALMALVAILMVLVALRWRRGWMLALALAVAGGISLWLFGGGMVLDMLMSSGTLGGLEARLEVWSRALYMIQDFPITGVGIGAFGPVADLLYPFFLAPVSGIPHAHNLFLQVAVDLGIPGLIAWLSIFFLVLAISWRVYRHGRAMKDERMTSLGAGLLGSQVALMVNGIVNVSVWGAVRTAPIVWALWGVAMVAFLSLVERQRSDIDDPSAGHAADAGPATPQEPLPPSDAAGSRRAWWIGLGLLLVGLLLVTGWLTFTGVRLFGHARSLLDHLQYVETLAQGDANRLDTVELENAGQHLAGMRHDLEAVQSLVGPVLPASRVLGWIPKYGGDLASASELLEIAVGVAAAGDQAFQALSPALDLLDGAGGDGDSTLSAGERLLPVLVAAQPELMAAQQKLGAVAQARARLKAQELSPRVAGLVARLDRYLPWFETAVDGALLAPELLGANGPRTYLIVAQNNQEMRATGGFISGVGVFSVEEGRLGSLSFGDSYAVDNLKIPQDVAPLDFQRTLFGELMLFRDANWDADFPTSARRILDIYGRNRGVQADGVIALDLTALGLLVDAVGPLRVEGIDEPVSGENVLQVILAQWNRSGDEESLGEWWLHRKDFMGQIAGAAMERLTKGQNLQPAKLAQALKTALDEKHILVYVADPHVSGLLGEGNWDGALRILSSPSDRLMVVDTNVGYNKVEPRVTRAFHYQVDLADLEQPRARLDLTYQHGSTQPVEECIQGSHYGDTYTDMMERCYWDYVRVHVPAGSRLLDGPDLTPPPGSLLAQNSDPVPVQTISPTLTFGNWSVWTAFFDLPTTEERVLSFDYRLPADVLEYGTDDLVTYRLVVQKQPGTGAVPLRVEVVLPPGAELVDSVSGGPTMDSDLRVDREFVIVFRP